MVYSFRLANRSTLANFSLTMPHLRNASNGTIGAHLLLTSRTIRGTQLSAGDIQKVFEIGFAKAKELLGIPKIIATTTVQRLTPIRTCAELDSCCPTNSRCLNVSLGIDCICNSMWAEKNGRCILSPLTITLIVLASVTGAVAMMLSVAFMSMSPLDQAQPMRKIMYIRQ
ncbi:unnamed protein product [Calicophoron daubneyi]|uniref:Uncharacterized protein n=1 Tax=Calicophoron daubneyi TaxID=300641 RepID=A0AAV2TNZ1_CALDB